MTRIKIPWKLRTILEQMQPQNFCTSCIANIFHWYTRFSVYKKVVYKKVALDKPKPHESLSTRFFIFKNVVYKKEVLDWAKP